MKISIFGMGYVGVVSGACLASLGHEVVGVDVSEKKIELLNAGKSPIVEEQIEDLVAKAVAEGRLRATTDAMAAVAETDVSFISVGTPSAPNGALSLAAVDAVVVHIARAIAAKTGPHTVIVRSTVVPGTTEDRIMPALVEHSGRQIGEGLELGFNPEFLREGSSVKDFYKPPYTIIGSVGEGAYKVVEQIYEGVDGPMVKTNCVVAESVKYLSNIYHAVKITFANEVGSLLKSFGVDGREAMAIFCQDKTLNISPAYLRPGYAFGGSCLPKDLRAFLSLARGQDIDLPFLGNVLASNERHIERAFDMIARQGRGRVAMFGLSFKPGTDDLRESPLVALAEKLVGKGYDLEIFDENVEYSRLMGANLEFINREIPHLQRLLRKDPAAMVANADTIVVGHAGADEVGAILAGGAGKTVVDLQGVAKLQESKDFTYEGICW
ncbi:MAG: GDP-mannose dehydrogenase [Rhodospirillaceae bacterium]|nr:GDP-mannose dehydrogenase [Rhodospirillaceae bacterium]